MRRNDIGPRICQARRNAGISRSQLAKALDVSDGYIRVMESGFIDITINYLTGLSIALGVSINELREGLKEQTISTVERKTKLHAFGSERVQVVLDSDREVAWLVMTEHNGSMTAIDIILPYGYTPFVILFRIQELL